MNVDLSGFHGKLRASGVREAKVKTAEKDPDFTFNASTTGHGKRTAASNVPTGSTTIQACVLLTK
jgi:hypothetical protein